MNVPDHLRYTVDHEWMWPSPPLRVGITAHAVEALGDIVFVELPGVGESIRAGHRCGEIESTKSVSDLVAPVDGMVADQLRVPDHTSAVARARSGVWLTE